MLPVPVGRGRVGLACVVTSTVGAVLAVVLGTALAVVLGTALAIVVVGVSVATVPVGSGGWGCGGAFVSRHAVKREGLIIAAPITTERTTSLMGDRPSYNIA
jgi:hypothetical protein